MLTILKYVVIDVLMRLKAKSSRFREFCEKCMKSLCSSISNTDGESFFLPKYNLVLTDGRRMNEENIRVCLCKIKTIRSLRNCFKICTEHILFHQTCFIWACQNHKIFKFKVNFAHLIELLTDINKQTYYLLA